jgi:uncharacterized protein YbjT (DUF2867 family)
MTSAYQHFAVIGAAVLGSYFIEGLLKAKAAGTISSVVVVSRSDIKGEHPQWVSQCAQFAIIDYDSTESLKKAFTGIDVVLSTIATDAVPKQAELAVAAKAANVKLFVPSEFGDPSDTATQGFWVEKKKIHRKLEELRLPYVLVFTGIWPDFFFYDPTWGFDIKNGTFRIGGEGNTPISWTSRPDAARFTVRMLTTLPASELEWRTFRVEGDRATFNECAERYEAKTGKKLEVTHIPVSTLKKNVEEDPNDLPSQISWVWELGEGDVGAKTDNHLWPEWNPRKIIDIIG